MAGAAAGPKLGEIASGGLSSSPFVPVPWRSGTITARGDAVARGVRAHLAALASSCVELARVERRAVARHAQHAPYPRSIARTMPSDTAALCPSSAVSGTTSAPREAAQRDTRGSLVTTIVRSIAWHSASALSTSTTMACTSCARSSLGDARAQALL